MNRLNPFVALLFCFWIACCLLGFLGAIKSCQQRREEISPLTRSR